MPRRKKRIPNTKILLTRLPPSNTQPRGRTFRPLDWRPRAGFKKRRRFATNTIRISHERYGRRQMLPEQTSFQNF